ncbi:MAG: hypothetical protein ACI9VR_002910 [Cognaticolwellia sp.]|jgi:hypothetical protein
MNENATLLAAMAESKPVLLIGDSDSDRFPATSFACYQKIGKVFHYLDMGSRDLSARSNGQPILHSTDELGDWGGDLALIWVRAFSAVRAVELAHGAGCKRIWFSFGVANPHALKLAEKLEIEVLEVGRCPVLFLSERVGPCRVHGWFADAFGLTQLAPQLHTGPERREFF